MKVSRLIEHLQTYHSPDEYVVAHIWLVDDVIARASEGGIQLTKEQAEDIIENIHNHIDCELGVSWDTIDVYTDDYLEEIEAIDE